MESIRIDGVKIADRILDLKDLYHKIKGEVEFRDLTDEEQGAHIHNLHQILAEAEDLYIVFKCDVTTITSILQCKTQEARDVFYENINKYII